MKRGRGARHRGSRGAGSTGSQSTAGDGLRWAIADWLLHRRLSRRELARRAGLGRATIQRLASGHARRVDLRTLAVLCRTLDVTPADLIVWHGQDPLPPGARSRARQLRLPGRAWR